MCTHPMFVQPQSTALTLAASTQVSKTDWLQLMHYWHCGARCAPQQHVLVSN